MDGRIPTGQKRLATGAGGIARPIGTAMRVTHTHPLLPISPALPIHREIRISRALVWLPPTP